MSRITMCLDCPEYQKGGYCRHKHKEIGALSPACDYAIKMNEKFNPEDEDAPLELAAPEPQPEDKRREERNQRRREARAAKRPLPEQVDHKVCKHCGRDLPIAEYYLKDGKPAWICKGCMKAYNVQKAKERRDARAAQENAGATTKVCKACGRELPLDAFGGHAKTWDHKATVCKECMVEKLTKNKAPKPTPAPVLDEPILLADIDTGFSLENVESRRLVEELRARGYTVKCQRPITVIEEL